MKHETFEPETFHARHIAVGTLQGFIAAALSLPTGLLTAGFLTRKLGPEGYGLLTVTSSIVVFIEIVITMGFSRATVKFVAEAADGEGVASRILLVQLGVSLGAVALLVAVAPVLASWLSEPKLATYLRILVLDIPVFALGQLHQSILVGRGDFGRRAILTASYWLSRLVLIFLLVGLGLSITGAILASIGASVVMLMIARLFVQPPLSSHSTLPIRRLWNYTMPLSLYTLGQNLFSRLDLWFVKALSGTPQAVGFYGAAQNLTFAVNILAQSLSPVLLSKLSRLSGEGQEAIAQTMSRQPIRLIFCVLPFAAMTAGTAKEIVVVIYGDAFITASPLLANLVFGALASTMIAVTASMLIAAGRPGLPFALTGPLVPLALVGHLILVPRFGAIGAAATTTVLAWVGASAFMFAACKIWRVQPPVATLLRSILLCGPAYGLAILWPTPGFLVLLKLLIVSLIIPAGFLLLGEFSSDEIAFIRSILHR